MKLGLRLDAAHHRVTSSVGRISLFELDRKRGADERVVAPGLAFYLMAPLGAREEDIPEDAISLIKATVARVFGRRTVAAETLKRLWSGTNQCENAWALLEAQDHTVAVRPARTGLSREYLSKAFTLHDHDIFDASNRARHEFSEPVRLLVEVSPKHGGGDETDWARLVERLAADAPATEAAEAAPAPRTEKQRFLDEHCLTAAQVASRWNVRAEDASSWASRKRRADELFGVWSSSDRTYMHPEFQCAKGLTDDHRRALFATLRTRAGWSDAPDQDQGRWKRATWLYQPNTALSKAALAAPGIDMSDPVTAALTLNFVSDEPRSPAEVFGEAPEAVIALAKELAPGEGHRD
ncbi:hypothetical protein RKE25_22855 (plasmid) [Dyella sp. BiH032]|uniref:hypothetical protein n=1 Tax=Dyella sp. BiH032 TaxID=3075430 RepID=UPI002893580E|nr:hypothetical protein [Dyella sp. BiH032]WNL48376.1 hypothetical protein RKE25_22855 [Dyella sp. BiH032]